MKTQIEEKFSDFYEKWMAQLEDLLQLLLEVSKEESQEERRYGYGYEAVVKKLTSHHKEYYTFKWASAHEDVLAFFAPVWLSSLENAHLWITGWKPSTAFRLIVVELISEEQVKKMAGLRVRIKVEEERVEREMERQQVAMADRRMMELVRLERRAAGGSCISTAAVADIDQVEVRMQGLLADLEKVMKMADCVRLKTLKGVLDILSPMQGVNFLASKSMLQIQLRKLGGKT